MLVGTIYTLYGRRAGAEMYVEKIIRGISTLPDSGTELLVFCNKEAYEVLPDQIHKIYLPQLDSQLRKALWLEFNSGQEIRKHGVDVFWIPSGTNHFPGRWDVPTVVTFHDFGEYHVKNKYDFKRTVYRKCFCIPRSVRRATLFTAVSETTASDLKRLFCADQPVHVVYSGPSPWESSVACDDADCSALLGATGKSFPDFIFVPGRTDYHGKGIDVLLVSYKRLLDELGPACPDLYLAGPQGENHEELMRDIGKLELHDKVAWLGRVPDDLMAALYRKCRFVVLASRYEGFGFPVLEAMNFGVPIVCSNSGALPEVAGNAALLFESGDAPGLYAIMLRLLREEELGTALVVKGEVRLKNFDWHVTLSQMNHIFQSARGSQ